MNEGIVKVSVDGAPVGEAVAEGGASSAPEVPQGDGLKTPRVVGTAEAEDAPKPAAKPPGERGVRRTKKWLECKLTEAEKRELYGEIERAIADVEAADYDVERIKERAKADTKAAENRAKELRIRLGEKARATREGRISRDVEVEIRVDWNTRKKITTRLDDGTVIDTEAATDVEVDDCGEWSRDLKAGKSYLKAPDGAVLRERKLTDAERQADLPLPDGGAAPAEPAKAERAWVSLKSWEDLDPDTTERFVKPDPHAKAPAIVWTEQGKYVVATIPAGLRPQLEHHAKQAAVRVFFGESEPTFAEVAAQSSDPPAPPRKGSSKKRPA